ncbi:hypothetical protein FHL15_007435 [Xylaria flabelliformis]|uniref:Integral membrane protein n=1 Tax=Xylaria flabelliformis TaxID=2512241 RepID=A0A553HUL7_9PEZI|nr:hypothetical protein FHL15_007435 [Xylaria flabelliformis]
MSHYTSDHPPPLPPRSPRPPITGYTTSSQYSISSFPPPPPPPPGLPPRTSAISPTPPGPPPPLPPRPAGYETRTPSNHPAPFVHHPSTDRAPASPNYQFASDLPLPPSPSLGPPPPYSAFVADISHSPPHQPRPEKSAAPNAAHSPLPSPVSGLTSPTIWANLPPPPPGPPPQLSPHHSPGIFQYSYNSSHSSSPIGAPSGASVTQSSHEPVKHQINSPSEAYNNDLSAPISPSEVPHKDQPPASSLQIEKKPEVSTFSHLEKPQIEAHSASIPLPNQTVKFHAVPPDDISDKVSPSISQSSQHPPLESSFQSLHISSTPPVPPKTPLVSGSTQDRPHEPVISASGSQPGYSKPSYKAYVPPPYGSSSKTTSPASGAANHPSLQQSVAPQARPAAQHIPAPRAVTWCIDTPITFMTDWYWHPEAADFQICSRCYVDYIHETAFRSEFRSARPADRKPRVCRFSKARMKDHLWKAAVASGSSREAVAWMRSRAAIPDCRGVEGVRRNAATGIKWFAPRNSDDVPNFLVCEACREDKLQTNQFAGRFAACRSSQPDDAVWACDMAIPFVEREYEEKGKRDDWVGFTVESKARLATQPCPETQGVSVYTRKWFVPKAGPRGFVLCAACFSDQVLHTGEEGKWEVAQGLRNKIHCARGIYNIRIIMALADQKKDWRLFWDVVTRLEREKTCEEDGIVDGVWYTLPSNPRDFGVCSACYLSIVEPLGVAEFWVRKRDVTPGTKVLCSFNMAHPKVWKFVPRLLEMYWTLDPSALDEYASLYASIPLCLRDEDRPNLRWYGWKDCMICPECYLDFARHSPLAKMMELHDTLLTDSVSKYTPYIFPFHSIGKDHAYSEAFKPEPYTDLRCSVCEMYSQRMRTLYTECGSTNPPNLKSLLEYSTQRRQVYMETIPQARMMMSQAKMALQQQKRLNLMSSHYTNLGQFQQNTYDGPYTYSAPGIGSGFVNSNSLQGAAYGQQAMNIAADLGSGRTGLAVGELEQRWRKVE